jgi:membrane peptidoglycan carboxypeptidase
MLIGLLGAGLMAPAVAASGQGLRESLKFYNALPVSFPNEPLPQTSRILYADGSLMATFYDQNRVPVPLDMIAPVMRQAVVAIEDSRFYEHGGVDPVGVLRAVVNNIAGGSTEGASTITQQWIKNMLAEQAEAKGGAAAYREATSRDYGRKIREMKLAIEAEHRLSKEQILDNYLNIALFGDGQYGVETASRHFFNKHAADLTLPEAALLAGMIQSPSAYEPVQHPKAATERRDTVLNRMRQLGYIDKRQHDEAVAVPVKAMLHVHPPVNGCQQAGSAAFFCDYVVHAFLQDKGFGRTMQDRQRLLYRGGLTITTTLDKSRQDAADAAVRSAVAVNDGAASALVSVEPGTGKIVAMAQNRVYDPAGTAKSGGTALNYSVDASMGGTSGFQTGSSFKPFTLATWLMAGKSVNQKVDAPRHASISYGDLHASCGRLVSDKPWQVGNSEGEGGHPVTVVQATYDSINTAYANMLRQLDLCKIYDTAKALHVHRADGKPMQVYPSFILGSEEVAPLTMAAAYAAFAHHGTWCDPMAISQVKNPTGKAIDTAKPACEQAIPAKIADGVTSTLHSVLTKGTGACCDIGWPASGKTGTTNSSTETWFVGYTKQLCAAVWVGTPDQEPSSLDGLELNGHSYRTVYGATVAAPTWKAYMNTAMQGLPSKKLP